jgi:hypothetical protein
MNTSGQSPLIFGPLPQTSFEADVGQSFQQQQQYNNGQEPQARNYQQQPQRGYIRWNQVKLSLEPIHLFVVLKKITLT